MPRDIAAVWQRESEKHGSAGKHFIENAEDQPDVGGIDQALEPAEFSLLHP
jgi:hypothetical protein